MGTNNRGPVPNPTPPTRPIARYGPKLKPLSERFAASVREEGDCLVWTAHTKGGTHPYGVLYDRDTGKKELAHRVAIRLVEGRYPDGTVMHRCDNPRCVRYEHLMIATQAANMTDKAIKRRGRNQYKRATRQQASEMQYRYAAGESQQNIADALGFDQTYVSRVLSKQIVHLLGSGDALPSLPKRTRQRRPAGRGRRVSKLTEDEVRQIRQLCGTLSQERIAKAFGVSKARINQIAAGRAWRHVT